jgi:hypothetical protein
MTPAIHIKPHSGCFPHNTIYSAAANYYTLPLENCVFFAKNCVFFCKRLRLYFLFSAKNCVFSAKNCVFLAKIASFCRFNYRNLLIYSVLDFFCENFTEHGDKLCKTWLVKQVFYNTPIHKYCDNYTAISRLLAYPPSPKQLWWVTKVERRMGLAKKSFYEHTFFVPP